MKLRGERGIIARSKTWNYDNDACKPRIFKRRLKERTYSRVRTLSNFFFLIYYILFCDYPIYPLLVYVIFILDIFQCNLCEDLKIKNKE